MSDDEIIKKRLLIDGDGTGEDRRLNVLLKQFLKWTYSNNDSPANNQMIFDRLMAQMAQCKHAAAKGDYTSRMISKELENYGKLSEKIERCIEVAKNETEESKQELLVAKEIRKNKIEYDMLAKIIKEQPERTETTKQIESLQKELSDLLAKKEKLERKFQKRRNDFTLLMHAVHELEAQLDDDSSSDSDLSETNEVIQTAGDSTLNNSGGFMEVSDEEEEEHFMDSKNIKDENKPGFVKDELMETNLDKVEKI